ncbi:MAG: hypothetical protein JNL64_07940 [Blastocatellia bacterium]|nr:hypothetical protein [Blastocatellia bacterium]
MTLGIFDRKQLRTFLVLAFFLIPFSFFLSAPASAQSRDYMTAEEVEIIREAQEIDLRVEVIVRMIDRRFKVLNIDVRSPWASKKEKDIWGPLPAGERIELLRDINKLIDKAISDIDNLSERPDAAILPDPEEKKPRTFKEMFPTAVRTLADAAARYKPVVEKELETSTDKETQRIAERILEDLEDITAGAAKLPPPEPKKPKKS